MIHAAPLLSSGMLEELQDRAKQTMEYFFLMECLQSQVHDIYPYEMAFSDVCCKHLETQSYCRLYVMDKITTPFELFFRTEFISQWICSNGFLLGRSLCSVLSMVSSTVT